MCEVWKEVSVNPNYEISTLGNITPLDISNADFI